MISRIQATTGSRDGSPAEPFLREYLPSLDGWRAIAILFVIASHSHDSITEWMPAWVRGTGWLASGGALGVFIFFAISGILITNRLILEQRERSRINLRAFYIRRFFRIIPPLFAMLLCLGTLSAVGVLAVPASDLGRALVFCSNYGPLPAWNIMHTWSLSIEEHFYLLWPMAVALVSRRRLVISVLILCLGVAAWRIGCTHWRVVPERYGSVAWRTDTQMDALLYAAGLAILTGNPKARTRIRTLLTPMITMSLVLGIACLELGYYFVPRFGHLARFLLVVFIPLIIVGTTYNQRMILSRILENGALRWIGRLSYSVYLWQQLFLAPAEFRVHALHFVQVFPANVLVTFAIANLEMNPKLSASIEPFELAVGETDGVADFAVFEDSPAQNKFREADDIRLGGSASTIRVNVTTLDRFCSERALPPINILKVDVDGFECHVLRGASRLLWEKKIRFVFLEVIPEALLNASDNVDELKRLLHYGGLTPCVLDNGGRRLIECELERALATSSTRNILCAADV